MPELDKIIVAELPVRARVGVTEEERGREQELIIDIELRLDLRPAGRSDDLRDTVDYERACRTATEVAASQPFHVIEAVAEKTAGALLADLGVSDVLVRVGKPAALRAWGARRATVEVRRTRDG